MTVTAIVFLVKAALAVYRLGVAIATERGAFDIFRKIRLRYGAEIAPAYKDEYNKDWFKTNLAAGLSCPYCVTFWLALVLAIGASLSNIDHDIILNWLAIAGLAALFVKHGTP